MPQIFQNFIFRSKLPNFERDGFDTMDEMMAVNPEWMDEGHISYLREDGKHYIYHTVNNKASWTALIPEEIEDLDDVLVYNTKEEMSKVSHDDIALGRIAYCREDKQIYYFAYDNTYEMDDPNQAVFDQYGTGFFHLLVDIADSDYVKESELSEMGYVTKEEVSDIKARGIKTFKTQKEMAEYPFPEDPDKPDEFIAYGQIVFCEEDSYHYYCFREVGDFLLVPEKNTGFFKRVKGITETNLTGLYEPVNVRPSAWVETEIGNFAGKTPEDLKHMPYDELFENIIFKASEPEFVMPEAWIGLLGDWNMIEYDEENNTKTYLVKVGDTSPSQGNFSTEFDENHKTTRGSIIYKNYPNKDGSLGRELYWAGETITENNVSGDELASYVYRVYKGEESKGVKLPEVELGDQEYRFRVYYKNGNDVKNSHGDIIPGKKWNNKREVISGNRIIINGTKPWYKLVGDELVEQPLIRWEDEMSVIIDVGPTSSDKQSFVVPRRPKSISVYNGLTGSFVPSFIEDYIYDELDAHYIDGTMGYSYTFNTSKCGHRGAVKLKVVF
jgi:hypothetical protein